MVTIPEAIGRSCSRFLGDGAEVRAPWITCDWLGDSPSLALLGSGEEGRLPEARWPGFLGLSHHESSSRESSGGGQSGLGLESEP